MKRRSSLFIISSSILLVALGFYLKSKYLSDNHWFTKNIQLLTKSELIELESASKSDVVYCLVLRVENKGQRSLQLKIVDSERKTVKHILISPRSAIDPVKLDWYENKVKLLFEKDDTLACDIKISYQLLSLNKE